MKKVYIASPYTLGDVARNVKRQIDVSDQLMKLGYVPFVPLLFHFQHIVHPRSHREWMEIDLEWLRSCDCVLRLRGESKGADIEELEAMHSGIPVFYSISDLLHYYTEEAIRQCSIDDCTIAYNFILNEDD